MLPPTSKVVAGDVLLIPTRSLVESVTITSVSISKSVAVTVPVTFTFLLKSHSSFVLSYNIEGFVAPDISTSIPAPFAAPAFAEPLASVTSLSSTVRVVLLIVVVVPST